MTIYAGEKDIIVNAGGKNIAPQPLENLLAQPPLRLHPRGARLVAKDDRSHFGAHRGHGELRAQPTWTYTLDGETRQSFATPSTMVDIRYAKPAFDVGFATNHLAISEDLINELKDQFTEDEIVELSLTIAGFNAMKASSSSASKKKAAKSA